MLEEREVAVNYLGLYSLTKMSMIKSSDTESVTKGARSSASCTMTDGRVASEKHTWLYGTNAMRATRVCC